MNVLPNKLVQAIQVCCYIAYHATPMQPVASAAIAEHYGLKKRALEAVLQQLKRAGVLASTQGQAGGYFVVNVAVLTLADIAVVFTNAALPQSQTGFEEFSEFLAAPISQAYTAWLQELGNASVADLCEAFAEKGMPKHIEPITDYAI